MSCKNAIAAFEKAKDVKATEADKVQKDITLLFIFIFGVLSTLQQPQVVLWGQVPPIDKLDASLSTLKACRCVAASNHLCRPGEGTS